MSKTTKKATPSKTRKSAEKPASPPAKTEEPAEATKATSNGFAYHTIGRLLAVMRSKGEDYPTKSAEDFALAAIEGLKPANAAEVLLTSQMVATWETGMAMLTGAKMATDLQIMTEKGALAAKLLSIFERQFATLTKARKPPQVVTVVHEHRHVHLNAPDPTGDEIRIEGQAHETIDARALALAPGPALLGQDPPRDALPVACDKARPMPHARRRTRDRRTKG